MAIITFNQFITEQDNIERIPMSRSQAVSKSADVIEGLPPDRTELMYNLQRATYKLVTEYPENFRRMLRTVIRSGKVDDDPEFKEDLKELAELIMSSKMSGTARRAEKEMRLDQSPIRQEKKDKELDNVVSPPEADRQGGGPGLGGQG